MNYPSPNEARQSPAWLGRSVIYQISLRAFTPEGTLAAAARRLPELAALGVDILYLCPVCLQDDDPRRELWSARQRSCGTENPRNPYRIKDFYAIDPEYGTAADLRGFVAAAHQLGLRVLLDVVFFHCGPTAVFIEDHPDFVRRHADGSVAYGGWHFPVLNYDHAGLCEYLWRNLEFWIRDFAVDGYRCDVADAVPLAFWETARARLERLNPEIVLLAEGHRREDQLRAFDLNYNFPWAFGLHAVFNQGKPASSLRRIWETQRAEYPAGARFIRYIDNHDIAHDSSQGLHRCPGEDAAAWQGTIDFQGLPPDGWPPDSRLDRAWGGPAVAAALALTFALDGVPMLYNGQEVADTAPHSIYDRMPVAWAKAVTPAGRARLALVRRLCELRHTERVLTAGSLVWIDNAASGHVLSFRRELDGERLLVVVNLSGAPVTTRLDGVWRPLLAASATGAGELGPFGFFIGKTTG